MDVLLKASLKRIFSGCYCRVGLDLIELAKCETTIILVNIYFLCPRLDYVIAKEGNCRGRENYYTLMKDY